MWPTCAQAPTSSPPTTSPTLIAQADYDMSAPWRRTEPRLREWRVLLLSVLPAEDGKSRFVAGALADDRHRLDLRRRLQPRLSRRHLRRSAQRMGEQINGLLNAGADRRWSNDSDTLNAKARSRDFGVTDERGIDVPATDPVYHEKTGGRRRGNCWKHCKSARDAKPVTIGINRALAPKNFARRSPTMAVSPIRWCAPIRTLACRTNGPERRVAEQHGRLIGWFRRGEPRQHRRGRRAPCCTISRRSAAAVAAERLVPAIEPRLGGFGLEPSELTPAILFAGLGERTMICGLGEL